MIEVELFGAGPTDPSREEVCGLCVLAADRLGVSEGHVAVEFVDAPRIAELNHRHRGRPGPTDVLSFPIDGAEPLTAGSPPGGASSQPAPPRELGDVVICLEHTSDVR